MALPLTIAVAIAHGFTVLVLRRSILTEKVARRGYHVSREYAIDELEVLFARDAMNADPTVLPANQKIYDALAVLGGPRNEKSQHLYPILDDDANLVGAITSFDLRRWAVDPHRRDLTLAVTAQPAHVVFSNETLRTAVERMAETGATRLLVVNPNDSRKLVGKIALHDVMSARTRHLQDERRRERILPVEYILPRWLRPRANEDRSR
jgi:CIC family chloride channel protein